MSQKYRFGIFCCLNGYTISVHYEYNMVKHTTHLATLCHGEPFCTISKLSAEPVGNRCIIFMKGQCWPLANFVLSPELCCWIIGRDSGHLMSYRTNSRFAPSQWETSLQSNAVSNCLSANLEAALSNMWGTSYGITILTGNPLHNWAALHTALLDCSCDLKMAAWQGFTCGGFFTDTSCNTHVKAFSFAIQNNIAWLCAIGRAVCFQQGCV